MESKEEIRVGTTIAKGQFIDPDDIFKEIVIIARSFHNRIYIMSMGMNTKVQGRLPLLQCVTFHSLLAFDGVLVLESIWRNTRRVWLVKTLGFKRIRGGIGSTHRGVLGTYSTNFRSKQHKLESRAWLTKGEDTITKGIMYLGKNFTRFFEYEGHYRMMIQ